MKSEKSDENDTKMLNLKNEMLISLEQKLEKSKNSDYRLYGGVRATLIFSPNCGLPNNEELNRICLEIQPMMYTQLWRKWDPINIPVSSEHIAVIGLQRQSRRRGPMDKSQPSKMSRDRSSRLVTHFPRKAGHLASSGPKF